MTLLEECNLGKIIGRCYGGGPSERTCTKELKTVLCMNVGNTETDILIPATLPREH